jgi:predicted secreted Zn-dependent protease
MTCSRERAFALLLLCVLASGACSLVPPVRTTPRPLELYVRERFYSLSAKDGPELNRELGRRGREVTGLPAYALTRWRLSWSYEPKAEGNRCAVTNPQVRIEIVTTLPRWDRASRAGEPLARDWSLFLERLRLHESGHQDIALRSGTDLLSSIRTLEASSCASLRFEAMRVAKALSATSEGDQLAFDVATRYGSRVVEP